jgi:RluA family pseudouridine synthase
MNPPSTVYSNISGYLFAQLDQLKEWREKLIGECKAHKLKGTILLSTEGINLFLAGQREGIDHVISVVRSIPGLEKFQAKFSESDHQPFNRMLVRIKKEIISFGVPEVDPAKYTSRHLPAATLKQWLDEGRPVTLIDTRNDYEVKLGTFRNAIPIGVDTFRQFPAAVAKLPEDLKKQPIVTFCTGGIRCEKAAPFMELQGFENVFQLDGGILKYFEEVGGDHYDGECFVFDHRVGLDPSLRETPSALCFHCQAPLEVEEQQDPRYVEGISCPYCFVSKEQIMQETLAKRRTALEKVVHPLPGSVPYENQRPLFIKQDFDHWKLGDLLVRLFPQIDESEWRQRLNEGRFRNERGEVVDGEQIVRSGERYNQRMILAAEPDVNADIRFLYEDSALIVIRKPAPLPMHPCGRFVRNTLQSIINQVVHPAPRPVHRLDANTAGLVLFARTRPICAQMQRQFHKRTLEKTYLVRVQGHPEWEQHRCEASISTGPELAGSREVDEENGLESRTDFRVLHRFPDGTALLQASLHSGRTNQIRVHLWHLGFPVCGDATYLLHGKVAATQTLDCTDEPMQLHAWRLSCDHPLTGERLTFEDERPAWAAINAI